MSKEIEMLGKKFGRLTVKKMFGERIAGRHPKWICKCDCGNESIKTSVALRSGREPSCGCAAKEFQRKKHSIVNQRFGKLFVLEAMPESDKKRNILWKCKCDCGNYAVVGTGNLQSGKTQSCGCFYKQSRYENIKHGHARAKKTSPTYVSWASMITRCTNKKAKNYKYYGEIGVTVCERWMSFENFLFDMGERPHGMTLDRIDPHGNYEFSNCRWADWDTQKSNKRNKK